MATGASGYGVQVTGWVAKPVNTINLEVDGRLQKILGAGAGTNPDGTIPVTTYAGQLKVLIVDMVSGCFDLMQATYSSRDPNQATDAAQDAICSLSGIVRLVQVFSVATGTCCGQPGTVLPVGRVAVTTAGGSTGAAGARFDTLPSTTDANQPGVTIAVLPSWAQTTPYGQGQRVTSNGYVFQCLAGGTGATSGSGPTVASVTDGGVSWKFLGGPPSSGAVAVWSPNTFFFSGQFIFANGAYWQALNAGTSSSGGTGPSTVADGSVTWQPIGLGAGAVDVPFQAEVAGPIGAPTGLLSVIATPVNGWQSVTNLVAGGVGNVQETSSALRARRDASLAGGGNSVRDAIRATILKVNAGSTDPNHQPPTACKVFMNDTDFTDPALGLPPHSVEVLAVGGTDADIAQAVWNCVAAGTVTYGNQTTSVFDSQGLPQVVSWSRPIAVPIFVTTTAFYDPTQWPPGSNAVVAQAALSALLTAYSNNAWPVGASVRQSYVNAAMMRGPAQVDQNGNAVAPADPSSKPVPGLLELTPLYIGTATGPTGTATVVLQPRQYAQFLTANCSITASSETP